MKSDTADLLLVVGHDAILLKTRAAVLRTAGFKVIVAQDADQAKLAAGLFALQTAIICHTLEPEERDALAIDLGYCSKRKMPIMKLQQQECQPAWLIAAARRSVDGHRAAYPVSSISPTYELAQVRCQI